MLILTVTLTVATTDLAPVCSEIIKLAGLLHKRAESARTTFKRGEIDKAASQAQNSPSLDALFQNCSSLLKK